MTKPMCYFAHPKRVHADKKLKTRIMKLLDKRFVVLDPFSDKVRIALKITEMWFENPIKEHADDIVANDLRLIEEADYFFVYFDKPSIGASMETWHAFKEDKYIIAIWDYLHPWILSVANEYYDCLDNWEKGIEYVDIEKIKPEGADIFRKGKAY